MKLVYIAALFLFAVLAPIQGAKSHEHNETSDDDDSKKCVDLASSDICSTVLSKGLC